MKKIICIIATLVMISALSFLNSCKKDDPPAVQYLYGGWITGHVFAENGTTPIAMANVFVDYEGEIYFTKTDADGYFKLLAPEGNQVLHIQTGKGKIFRTYMDVEIARNTITEIPEATVKLQQVVNLAYITGAYDEIQDIIVQSLGYTATPILLDDLDNLSTLQNYGAIFINCGTHYGFSELRWDNVRQFVEQGGSLYVSDWAVSSLIGYLSGTKMDESKERNAWYLPETTSKTCPARTGGFIGTDNLCTQRSGLATVVHDAVVMNEELATWLGTNTIDIEYDLPAWEVIKVLGNNWETLIYDDNHGYGPLAVRTNFNGSGGLSNKNGNQTWITICHYPPGNPANPQTITIPISAWPAHEAHGDHIGSCEGNGGSIVFTTFHNHPHEAVDENIQKILEYFIINL